MTGGGRKVIAIGVLVTIGVTAFAAVTVGIPIAYALSHPYDPDRWVAVWACPAVVLLLVGVAMAIGWAMDQL